MDCKWLVWFINFIYKKHYILVILIINYFVNQVLDQIMKATPKVGSTFQFKGSQKVWMSTLEYRGLICLVRS
jgi:hypothetical protein